MLKKLIVVCIILTVLTACRGNDNSNSLTQSNSSNIANGQVVTNYKGFNYMAIPGADGIYRFEKDISKSEMILAGSFFGISIADDWIYTRSDETGNSGIYRVKLDGTALERLIDDHVGAINIDGIAIYYAVIGSISHGGTEAKVNSQAIQNDEAKEGIYRLDLITKDITCLTDDKAMYLSLDEDWIYYLNYTEEGRIYKISADGKVREAIGHEAARFMVTEGEWIYYISNTGDIKRIKTDGTEEATILEANGIYHSINVSDDWLFIGVNSIPDGHCLMAYNINTTEEKLLYEGYTQMINVIDNFIYFSSKNEYIQMNLQSAEVVTVIFD